VTSNETVEFDGLIIDYSRMGEEDLLATMLSVAERRGLLRWHGPTADNRYSISVGDRMFPLLTAEEVPGVVIGIAVMTGDGLGGLAYRPGVTDTARADTDSVDRAPHGR
jgi:hypothetical protein